MKERKRETPAEREVRQRRLAQAAARIRRTASRAGLNVKVARPCVACGEYHPGGYCGD